MRTPPRKISSHRKKGAAFLSLVLVMALVSGMLSLGSAKMSQAAIMGGENFHQLTVAEMPSHQHDSGFGEHRNTRGIPFGISDYLAGSRLGSGKSDYDNVGFLTSSTGGNQPHENRPPYYALYYIMKL